MWQSPPQLAGQLMLTIYWNISRHRPHMYMFGMYWHIAKTIFQESLIPNHLEGPRTRKTNLRGTTAMHPIKFCWEHFPVWSQHLKSNGFKRRILAHQVITPNVQHKQPPPQEKKQRRMSHPIMNICKHINYEHRFVMVCVLGRIFFRASAPQPRSL